MREFIFILLVLVIGIMIFTDDNSMNKSHAQHACEETNSFDTCFSTLNR